MWILYDKLIKIILLNVYLHITVVASWLVISNSQDNASTKKTLENRTEMEKFEFKQKYAKNLIYFFHKHNSVKLALFKFVADLILNFNDDLLLSLRDL